VTHSLPGFVQVSDWTCRTGRRVRSERLSRLLFGVAAIVVGASLAASLAWALATLAVRPLDGVEGDVLFEASRVRAGLPLYVDPVQGAHEQGAPPARYLVLYPPLWSLLLAIAPSGAALYVGRIVATSAWLGTFAWIVKNASPARRRATAAFGAFAAGVWVLALYGASARPDGFAILLAGFALTRSARRAEVDFGAGALFVLAALVKPNVVGAMPGAFVAAFLTTRTLRPILRGALGAVTAGGTFAAFATVLVGTRWIEHLTASTMQGPSASLWRDQMIDRGPFFLLPFAVVAGIGYRARRDPGALVATGALVTSVVWAIVSLAKIGSASNYFLEPCVAAAVVLSRANLPSLSARARVGAAMMCIVHSSWTGVASVQGALRGIPVAFARARALASVRATCGALDGGIVLGDEPGIELSLDGRIVQTPFQSTHRARLGKFPVDRWEADITHDNVRCLVMQDDLLERPLDRVDVAHDRFGPELRGALVSRFELVARAEGYLIYRVRAKKDDR